MFKWLTVAPYNEELDILGLYCYGYDAENFSVYLDDIYYESLLNNDTFEIFSLEDCKIDKEEYVQSFVIRKNLEKIYYNTLIILQNIKYKFYEDLQSPYPVIIEKIYNNRFLGFTEDLSFETNFNIGINEILQAEVVNRCIQVITDLQNIILLYFLNNKNDKLYLSPNPVKLLPQTKNYTYFADESIFLNPNPVKLNIFDELSPTGGILTTFGGAPYKGDGSIIIEDGVNI